MASSPSLHNDSGLMNISQTVSGHRYADHGSLTTGTAGMGGLRKGQPRLRRWREPPTQVHSASNSQRYRPTTQQLPRQKVPPFNFQREAPNLGRVLGNLYAGHKRSESPRCRSSLSKEGCPACWQRHQKSQYVTDWSECPRLKKSGRHAHAGIDVSFDECDPLHYEERGAIRNSRHCGTHITCPSSTQPCATAAATSARSVT